MLKKLSAILIAVMLVVMSVVPAMAADFTPSVAQKAAPELKLQTAADGTQYAAIIKDKDGKELAGVSTASISVTAMSAAGTASAEIKDKLNSAYNQLNSAANLTAISGDLEAVLKEAAPEVKAADLVVRDLFDVSVDEATAAQLAAGNSITVKFALAGGVDSLAAVLHNIDGTTWETVPNSRITRNADNTVSISFNSLSPIAFLFDGSELDVAPAGPTSPQTGYPEISAAVYVAIGAGMVLLVGFVASRKRVNR